MRTRKVPVGSIGACVAMPLELRESRPGLLRGSLEGSPLVKSCPYCKEEVRDDAVKCRYCQSTLSSSDEAPAGKAGRTFTVSFDQPYVRYATLLLSILSIIVVYGAVIYGVDLKKAGAELSAQRELNVELKQAREAARLLLDETRSDLVASKEQVKQVRDDLQDLRGGTLRDDSLQNALTAIESLQKSIGLLDERLRRLEVAAVVGDRGTPEAQVSPSELTDAEQQEIAAAIQVHQRALPVAQAADAAATPGRRVYEVEYSVSIDDTAATRRHGGSALIEKVTYRLDDRWFSNPEHVSIDPANNFRLSVRVWGSTKVEVAIVVKGLDAPIERSRLMSLSEPVSF